MKKTSIYLLNKNITRIILLFTLFGLPGVWSFTKCYHCIWILEGTELLPSAANKSDICRPENFNPNVVQKEICTHNCLTMILYNYVDTTLTTSPTGVINKSLIPSTIQSHPLQQSPQLPQSLLNKPNGTQSAKERKIIMSVFFRGCSRDNILRTKPNCQVNENEAAEMHQFQQKCYCIQNFCNGEVFSSSSSSSNNKKFTFHSIQYQIILTISFVFPSPLLFTLRY